MDEIINFPNCGENISDDYNLPLLLDVLIEGFTRGDLDSSHNCLKNVALTVNCTFSRAKVQIFTV